MAPDCACATVDSVYAAGAATLGIADLLARDFDACTAAMTPSADSEARERLFGGWVDALALPLRESPRTLTLTRRVEGPSTGTLVVETPEPLAFSRDVSLGVRRRLHTPPLPPHGGPGDVETFVANLEFGAHALVVPVRPPALGSLRAIVRAVRTGRRPDGRELAPIMPWRSYAALTDADARDLAAYLKTLPPSPAKVPGPVGPSETAPAPYLTVVVPK